MASRRCCPTGVSRFASAGTAFAALVLAPVWVAAQGPPQVQVSPFNDPRRDVRVLAEAQPGGAYQEISVEQFEKLPHASDWSVPVGMGQPLMAYEYDEPSLTPNPNQTPILHVHLLAAGAGQAAAGMRQVWYQRFLLSVRGDAAFDGPFAMGVTVSTEQGNAEGKISLIMHRKRPDDALRPKTEPLVLEVATSGESEHRIELTNTTGCEVILGAVAAPGQAPPAGGGGRVEAGEGLWQVEPRVEVVVARLAPGGAYERAVKVLLVPNTRKVFWSSLRPFSEDRPHSRLELRLPFKVDGGHVGELRRSLNVKFKPSVAVVFLFAALGGLLGGSLGILGGALISGGGKGTMTGAALKPAVVGGLKRIAFSALTGLVVFLVYLLLNELKVLQLGLFSVPLDPSQILPGFVIGLIVGLRPVPWWMKLLSLLVGRSGDQQSSEPNPANPAGAALVACAIALGGASSALAGSGGAEPFRPVALTLSPEGSRLHVVTSSPDRVWIVSTDNGPRTVVLAGELPFWGTATDHCVIVRDGVDWVASVFLRPGESSGPSDFTGSGSGRPQAVTLTSLSPGFEARRPEVLLTGFTSFFAVACDGKAGRLLLTDWTRLGIYSVPIDGLERGKEKLLASSVGLRTPTAIAFLGERIFVGDAGRHEVLEIVPHDDARPLVRVLIPDVGEPRGLATSPDGRLLCVADGQRAQVRCFDLSRTVLRGPFTNPVFREPSAVAIGAGGQLWVADATARAVFELTAAGTVVRRIRPDGEASRQNP